VVSTGTGEDRKSAPIHWTVHPNGAFVDAGSRWPRFTHGHHLRCPVVIRRIYDALSRRMVSSGLVSHEHETLIHDLPADCLHSTVLDLNGFVCTYQACVLCVLTKRCGLWKRYPVRTGAG
jgi:hypothetical protein